MMSAAVEASKREGPAGLAGAAGAGGSAPGGPAGNDPAECPAACGEEAVAASETAEETEERLDVEALRERQRLHGEYRRWMLANSRGGHCSSGSAGGAGAPGGPSERGQATGGSARDDPGRPASRAGDSAAASSSGGGGQARQRTPSEAWEEGRKAWRARKGSYKRHLPVSASSMRDFNFEDYILYPGREFPVPIALPDAVDMLVDIWLQEGMYDNS